MKQQPYYITKMFKNILLNIKNCILVPEPLCFCRTLVTALSVVTSKTLVASFRDIIACLFNRPLAMATCCFCPLESCHPLSPIMVSYPLDIFFSFERLNRHGCTNQSTSSILLRHRMLTARLDPASM